MSEVVHSKWRHSILVWQVNITLAIFIFGMRPLLSLETIIQCMSCTLCYIWYSIKSLAPLRIGTAWKPFVQSENTREAQMTDKETFRTAKKQMFTEEKPSPSAAAAVSSVLARKEKEKRKKTTQAVQPPASSTSADNDHVSDSSGRSNDSLTLHIGPRCRWWGLSAATSCNKPCRKWWMMPHPAGRGNTLRDCTIVSNNCSSYSQTRSESSSVVRFTASLKEFIFTYCKCASQRVFTCV